MGREERGAFRLCRFGGVVAASLGLAACQTASNMMAPEVELSAGSPTNIQSLSEVVKSSPRDPGPYNTRGAAYAKAGRNNIYRQTGQPQLAMADFNEAIRLRPNDALPHHSRGLLYQAAGQHQQAADEFSTAIALNPNAPEPYSALGQSQLALGDFKAAADAYTEAVRRESRNAQAWAYRGLAYERLGDRTEAMTSYQNALGIDKNQQQARDGIL